MLWKSVMAFDAHQGKTFSLKAMSMWNIHNISAYGLFVGCVTKGTVGHPPYGPTIKSSHPQNLRKLYIVEVPIIY